MDVPFVSEDFQRAFRNQFPAQLSTGRDLHVSDVVIPIVDFTPTASGASLPFELRNCVNGNTAYDAGSTDSSSTTTLTAGFYNVTAELFNTTTGTNAGARFFLKLYNQGVEKQTLYVFNNFNAKLNNYAEKRTFNVYIPSGHTLGYEFYVGTSVSSLWQLFTTNIADVNGNLTNPYNYSPQ